MFNTAHSSANTMLSPEEFFTIMEQHQLWLKSNGAEGRRANLRDMDLRHISLKNLNLMQSSLRGACLQGVDLSGAFLNEADLSEADLTDAYASNIQAVQANFTRAKLSGADIRQANCQGATMLGVQVQGADARRIKLQGAQLRDSDWSNARLDGSQWAHAGLRGATLASATLDGSDFTESDCRDAFLSHVSIKGTRFTNAQCRGLQLDQVLMNEADFSGCDVDTKYKDYAAELERKQLQAELSNLAMMRDEIHQIEQSVVDKKAELSERAEKIMDLQSMELHQQQLIARYGMLFRTLAMIWAVVIAAGATVSGVLATQPERLQQLDAQMVATLAGVGAVLLLALHGLAAIAHYRLFQKLLGFFRLREVILEEVVTPQNTLQSASEEVLSRID